MDIDDIRRLIASKLGAEWDTSLGTVVYPNQPSENNSGKLHYDFQLVFPPTGRQRMSIGQPKDIRQTGYAYLLGYAPVDTGTSELNKGLIKFQHIFEEAIITELGYSIRFREVNIVTLGLKNQMYRSNAVVEFYTDFVS